MNEVNETNAKISRIDEKISHIDSNIQELKQNCPSKYTIYVKLGFLAFSYV